MTIAEKMNNLHCRSNIIMPPIEKRGHIVLHLSVGRSVDQGMAAQYLLTSLLESCRTWNS